MKKSTNIARSTSSGCFVAKPLGKGKAEKFARVEGMTLNKRSAGAMAQLERQGLKGDALRSAIAGSFAMKRG